MTAKTAKNGMMILALGSALMLGSCAKEIGDTQSVKTSSEGVRTETPVAGSDKMEKAMFVPGEAVVVFSDEMTEKIERATASDGDASSADFFDEIRKELGISRMERLFPYAGEFEERTRAAGLHKFYLVDFDETVSLDKAEKAFETIEGLELFERQHRVTNLAVNDPYFKNLWALSSSANPTTNINVEPVWEYTMGDPNVIVNVVDTGLDLDHEDLAWNCSAKDHYNFVKNNTTIVAGDHGTHVGGTIAGVGNNGKGVIGIAGGDYAKGKRGVTLLSSEVFEGNSSARDFAKAIIWGADHGAVISQNSWGYSFDYDNNGKLEGDELSAALSATIDGSLKAAVDYFIQNAGCDKNGNQAAGAPMKGGLVVFAAGNDGIQNGAPANYEPIFSVGAVKKSGALDSYSNYGSWVDICAPGTNITSTFPDNKYSTISGTSMACPHVSGAAALLLSYFQRDGMTCDDLEEMLREGANPTKISHAGKAMGPYLDVYSSFLYGVDKFARQYNNDPVIELDYDGDLTFRHWEDVSVPFHIYDPDGDRLEVTSKFSGRGSLVKDETRQDIYNLSVLCQLVNETTPQKFTITAKDIYDATVTEEFSYTVLPNRAPEIAKDLENFLFNIKDRGTDVDITGLFSDPDEEPLRTTVMVAPSGVVRANLSDDESKINISVTGTGLASVFVTASDHMGEKVSAEFKVLVRSGEKDIDIYPNPVVNILHIRTGLEPEEMNVRLATATGATAFNGPVTCSAFNPGEIDMTTFAPGQYKLFLTDKDGKKTEMTIIKK